MSQSGLRHAATEPDNLDARRERSRRGAAGRAAVLRRAPSDSDCSGETASLSADSADRVRPAPIPQRTTKARSRRRGSEWEVLEGLKDGQRFERRPEVFNGYLHKKRKWPLKGWHKRFFVVDGGILVYARSPTDVARGRLHGSVDVGLSVISAKAQRRRIDIDADEFIYHLRAKTPDVFRTWLNVLKAHRLYRQHLLTFGARESVPKIHAPLQDLPPNTDTSSQSVSSSSSQNAMSSAPEQFIDDLTRTILEPESIEIPTPSTTTIPCNIPHRDPVLNWNLENEVIDNTKLLPLYFEPLEDVNPIMYNRSLCSMHCLAKIYDSELKELSKQIERPFEMISTEKQLHITELEKNSLKPDTFTDSSLVDYTFNSPNDNLSKDSSIRPVFPAFSEVTEFPRRIKVRYGDEKVELIRKRTEPTATFFLFARRSSGSKSPVSQMRRSKKCTNLYKYRNMCEEPRLDKSVSKMMLLRKQKPIEKVTTASGNDTALNVNDSVQASINKPKQNKSLQDTMSASEYDEIAEQIVMSIFETNRGRHSQDDTKFYINQMVQDLYQIKLSQREQNPVKTLFRCLLEYWLKTSARKSIKSAIRNVKSVVTQVNSLAKDQKLCSLIVSNQAKATQVHPCVEQTNDVFGNNKLITCSCLKERRIQELERLLKNTIYTFETVCSDNSKEKDIKITKKLINNLDSTAKNKNTVTCSQENENHSSKRESSSISKDAQNTSNSSAEYAKMQETFNLLVNEGSIPPMVIKQFLGAYLDVLIHNNSNRNSNTQSSIDSKISQERHSPVCEVQTESVQRKVSIGVFTNVNEKSSSNKMPCTMTTLKAKCAKKLKPQFVDIAQDPGQMYLDDFIHKVTKVFSRNKNNISVKKDQNEQPDYADTQKSLDSSSLNKSSETNKEKSVVIDLTKYNLDQISMKTDATLKGTTSITIKLKERYLNYGESRKKNVNLKFPDDNSVLSIGVVTPSHCDYISSKMTTKSYCQPNMDPKISFKNPYIHCDATLYREKKELSSSLSTSDATSKANKLFYDSGNSDDCSLQNNSRRSIEMHDDPQSCYIMSLQKSNLIPVSQNEHKKIEKDLDSTAPVNYSLKIDTPKVALIDKSKSIDENFIILLLENLTLLSQTMPALYKDLNVFYLKLKRKHDKSKTLGLLGQIYSDHRKIGDKVMRSNSGNSSCCTEKSLQVAPFIEASINTEKASMSNALVDQYIQVCNLVDQSTNAVFTVETKDCETYIDDFLNKKTKRNVNIATDSIGRKERAIKTETATSCPNWLLKLTKDGAISTAIRYIIKSDSPENFRFIAHGGDRKAIIQDLKPIIQLCQSSDEVFTRKKEIEQSKQVIETRKSSDNIFPKKKNSVLKTECTRKVLKVDMTPIFKNISTELDPSTSEEYYTTRDENCTTTTKDNILVFESNQDIRKELNTQKSRQCSKNPTRRKRKPVEIVIKAPNIKSSSHLRTSKSPKLNTNSKENSLQNKMFIKPLQSDKKNEAKRIKRDYNVYPTFFKTVFPLNLSSSTAESSLGTMSDDIKTIYRCSSDPSLISGLLSPSTPLRVQAGFVAGTPGGRLANWIVESGGPLEIANRELGQAQLSVQQLQRLLDAIELSHHHHDTDQVSLEGASPNVKKDRRKFGLRKKKSNSKCASVELAPSLHVDPSASHTALSALTAPPSPGGGASSVPNSAASLPIACAAARPQSLPGAESLNTNMGGGGPASLASLTPDQQLKEDFTVLAKDLVATLKGVVSTLVCERGRLRVAMESGEPTGTPGGAMVSALRTNLTSALQQNSELRSRLSRIHDASDLAEISSVNNTDPVNRQFQQSLSYSSSCVSASEFFDAEEHDPPNASSLHLLPADETGVIELDGDSSSEAGSLSSEEGSAGSSDNSEGAMLSAEPTTLRLSSNGAESSEGSPGWRRRTRLPCPRPTPGGPSLWNLLYKNIGKDLSQVSMPVTINEPLNMLQRLCEELEYCDLLDAASDCLNDIERMSLIAAFAVSAYAATAHRAASKPFNPLLAETYECVRADRGFKFLAEQVSHHPPISACHAEGSRWVFWQEARIKTKFWGKSMEFQPAGRVHVRLLPSNHHYSWNKVTTCVHNLFGGQRWVDQYGDMHITCHGTTISAKLNFIKASSWSSSRHEVRGAVSDEAGGTRVRLAGRWSEGLFAGDPPSARCLWRPGTMPPEHDLYYGFTRFAMELNEMEPGLRELLPHTDTRFRPDQRALEEGDVDAAEQYKHELEQAQRERRRDKPNHTAAWFRKLTEDGEEMWVFTGEYWKAREAGFSDASLPRIW